jgi:hypothetical protein
MVPSRTLTVHQSAIQPRAKDSSPAAKCKKCNAAEEPHRAMVTRKILSPLCVKTQENFPKRAPGGRKRSPSIRRELEIRPCTQLPDSFPTLLYPSLEGATRADPSDWEVRACGRASPQDDEFLHNLEEGATQGSFLASTPRPSRALVSPLHTQLYRDLTQAR